MLSIDPGPRRSAFVDAKKGGQHCSGMILDNYELLQMLPFMREQPIAIEMIASYGMPVGAEVFETCLWIGRFIQAHLGQYRLVKRAEVKIHICGSMKAKDTNIRQALLDRIGPVGTKASPGPLYGFKADMFAALAVALTAQETAGLWQTAIPSNIKPTQGALCPNTFSSIKKTTTQTG